VAPGVPSSANWRVERDQLSAVAPDSVMKSVEPYADVVRAQQDMIASLTWLFGAIGLLLAAVGLYGITAYTFERIEIALWLEVIDQLRQAVWGSGDRPLRRLESVQRVPAAQQLVATPNRQAFH